MVINLSKSSLTATFTIICPQTFHDFFGHTIGLFIEGLQIKWILRSTIGWSKIIFNK